MRWYLNRTGNAEGPFDEATLLGMIARGEVVHVHQICVEGAQTWEALLSHPPFAQAVAAPPQAPPQAPQGAEGPTDVNVLAPPSGAFVHGGAPSGAFVHGGAAAVAADAHGAAPAFGANVQGAAPAFAANVHGAAHAVAADVNAAANTFGADMNAAANTFGAALASPGGQQPVLAAPTAAAPGEGFFELAQAQGAAPSEEAKAGAGMAHLLAAAGAVVSCGCLGGVAGAFLGSILYKEQPKSPFALYHINQALVFQGVIFVVNVALAILFVVLRFVGVMILDILGLVFLSFHLVNVVLWAAAIIVPFLQRGKAMSGEWSEYPIVGAKVRRLKSPILK